ncbi:RND transporter, partial [Acinetobacter baumannii]
MTTLHFSATRRPALRALALALPLALAGCALTPTWQRPAVPVPAAWDDAASSAADAGISATWWQQFGSEDLNRLMAEALANNRDLAAAASRIEQSRASARISGAGL